MPASVFMLAVLIVYVPNQGHFPTSLGVMGLNVFNILFAITLITLMLRPASVQGATPRPPLTGILLAYYGVFTVALVMALLRGSPHPVDDVIAYKNVITYSLLFFLAYYGVRSVTQARFLLGLVLAVFVGASIEAIGEGLAYGLQDYDNAERASGPFGEGAGNSNFAGVYYAIFATFSLAVALLGKRIGTRYRLLAGLAYLIGCVAILATFSRQAFLVIGVTTLLLALRRNPLVAIGAVGVMLAYPLWAPQGVIERIEMTRQETALGQEVLDNSAASRYELWGGAVEIVKKHPAGIGLNQFQDEIEPYLPGWIMARDAQNQFLRIAAEAGIQGLLVFLLLLASFMRMGLRMRRLEQPPEAKVLGTAFLLSVLAVCLGNIFSSTFVFGEIMANFWIMAGLLARYLVLAERGELATTSTRTSFSIADARQVYARWQDPHEADH